MMQFATDLEGPLTLNDNAFEVTAHFLKDGDRFFTIISRYDDMLADVLKREGYKAGNTLKLILPFFLAYGLSDQDLKDYAGKHLRLVPRAPEALQCICLQMPAFIISTSYEPYVHAACEALDFPFDHAYCTRLSLDSYVIPETERRTLQTLYAQILTRPLIEMPERDHPFAEFSAQDQETIRYLDEIFWTRITRMKVGQLLQEVQPVGGPEKAQALRHTLERTGVGFSDAIYVGDSITDVETLELIRREGGLAVAFNGNRYALRAAELGCISLNAHILAHIAEAFTVGGRAAIRTLRPKEAELTTKIDEDFIQRSGEMRRRLRGEQIGGLG